MKQEQQGKKPTEWFQMLKEPYRSEAIANIDEKYKNLEYSSLPNALKSSNWHYKDRNYIGNESYNHWSKIYYSIKAGETTYLEPELIGNTDNLKPEPIELRPEELVSGEVYTAKFILDKWTFKFDGLANRNVNPIEYSIMYNHQTKEYLKDFNLSNSLKFYHATPEEKALLLGEEEKSIFCQNCRELVKLHNRTCSKIEKEWKAKFEELQKEYNDLKEAATESNIELKEKIRELELQQNNKEKVYFYMNENIGIKCTHLQSALDNSKNNNPIYEAVKIGVKKSVLVNE